MTTTRARDRLNAEISRRHLSRTAVALAITRPLSWLSGRLDGGTRMTLDDAELIGSALGLSLDQLTDESP